MVYINTTGKQNQVWLDKPYGTVGCPDAVEAYRSGFTAGVEDQKSKLSSLSISGNGEYVSEDGFSAVTVDVPQEYTPEDIAEAFQSGVTEQKAKMKELFAIVNGVYDREDGWKRVTVDVPQTGQTINNQDKEVILDNPTFGTVTEAGRLTGWYTQEVIVRADSGYTGLGTVSALTTFEATEAISYGEQRQKEKLITETFSANGEYNRVDGWKRVTVDVPPCQGYEEGYADGEAAQKAKLIPSAFRANGTYFREDGYSQAIVNVPDRYDEGYDSGYTDGYTSGKTDAWQPAYNSGYTDGINAAGGDYASGYTDGFDAGYDSGVTDGYASGYTSGKTDGFGEGYDSGYTDGAASVDCQPLYDSGYTDGYESGHTDGYVERAAILTAMTITANGAYESVEGWSAVTVNVPQTGYTQQDLDNAYASGLTNGYDSGWTAGYGSGYTDGRNACGGNDPLTIETLSAGTILWIAGASATPRTVEYKLNDGEWRQITSTTAGTPLTLAAGDRVLLRGDNPAYCTGIGHADAREANQMLMVAGKYKVSGNMLSLIDSTGYASLSALDDNNMYAFSYFFAGGLGMVDAEGLLLPTSYVPSYMCYSMFDGCTNLTHAPATLPAMTVKSYGYCKMFHGCSNLTTAPELPATELSLACYEVMFQGCFSLAAAPALPATTLARMCYEGMFRECFSLTAAPALPAVSLSLSCYSNMFDNCSALTQAPALPATTLANNCYEEMFRNCRSLVNAPALPATSLTENCYSGMFAYCTSMLTAPALPATTLANKCYAAMFSEARNLGYIKCGAIMFGTDSTKGWVHNVAGTGTFVKDANASWTTGDNGIPTGWTAVDA